MKALRLAAVLGVFWAIYAVFSPDETAWEWFMADKPIPGDLAGASLYVDAWHSALFKTRLIAIGIFILCSFVGAFAHGVVEQREAMSAYYRTYGTP